MERRYVKERPFGLMFGRRNSHVGWQVDKVRECRRDLGCRHTGLHRDVHDVDDRCMLLSLCLMLRLVGRKVVHGMTTWR